MDLHRYSVVSLNATLFTKGRIGAIIYNNFSTCMPTGRSKKCIYFLSFPQHDTYSIVSTGTLPRVKESND